MVTTYPEIRNRIYKHASKHKLRVDWLDYSPEGREALLYNSRQELVARAFVPLRYLTRKRCVRLAYALEDVFEKGWMN